MDIFFGNSLHSFYVFLIRKIFLFRKRSCQDVFIASLGVACLIVSLVIVGSSCFTQAFSICYTPIPILFTGLADVELISVPPDFLLALASLNKLISY